MTEERKHGPEDAAGHAGQRGGTDRPPAARTPGDAPSGPASVPEGGEEQARRRRPSELDRLKQELERARAEAAGRLDDARRLKADFENYRKRVLKEQTALVDHASAGLIEKLLPVLDDFELALIAADRTKDYGALVRGVELVYGRLLEILHREGLAKIGAEGDAFDPEAHEAVMAAEGSAEGEPFVSDVLRAGYELKGRVLRPAMVKVARR